MMDLCPTLAALTTLCDKAIDQLATVVAPCRLLEGGNLKVVDTCDRQKPNERQQCRLSVFGWYIKHRKFTVVTLLMTSIYYDVIVSNGGV